MHEVKAEYMSEVHPASPSTPIAGDCSDTELMQVVCMQRCGTSLQYIDKLVKL
jgi:hypothetical protein